MQTKQFKHKRKGGSYRIHAIAKGSGTLNTTGVDTFVVYHNELGQHFVRPLAEFCEAMNEVKKPQETEVWQGNWPASADDRMLPIMQNGNTGEHYDVDLAWTEHDGRDCPVTANTLVMVTTRDGNSKRAPALAGDWYWVWHDRPTPSDITHYKTLPPGDE